MSLMKAIRELLFGKKCTCGGHCHCHCHCHDEDDVERDEDLETAEDESEGAVDVGPDGEELEEADGPGDVDINAYAGESTEGDEAEELKEPLDVAVLKATKRYRSACDVRDIKNDPKCFTLCDEVPGTILDDSVRAYLTPLGFKAKDEHVFVRIDLSVSDVVRLLVVSSRGVYVYVGEGYEADDLGDYEYEKVFISWTQLAASFDRCEFESELGDADGFVWFVSTGEPKNIGGFFPSDSVAGGVVDYICALREIAQAEQSAVTESAADGSEENDEEDEIEEAE